MKSAYHHGELRQALLDAARDLVRETGTDGFSLSDACRRAGVSTAAPYRHFADKHAILNEVVAQGFADLADRMRQAAAEHPEGSADRILAIGSVYLRFAVAEPALFRLMFAQKPDVAADHPVVQAGKACFGHVVQEVVNHCQHNRIAGDALMIALQLWTLVHGASALTIDGDYAKMAPDLQVEQLMARGADRLLFSLPRHAG